jgi:hypothetical protein
LTEADIIPASTDVPKLSYVEKSALHVTVLWILLNVCLAALDILNLDLVLCCWGCLCAIYCIVNNYCTVITFILIFCKFLFLVLSQNYSTFVIIAQYCMFCKIMFYHQDYSNWITITQYCMFLQKILFYH